MSFQIKSLNSDLIDEVVKDAEGNEKVFKLRRLSFAATMQLHASALEADNLPSDTPESVIQKGKMFLDHLLLLYPEAKAEDFDCFTMSELPLFYKHSMAIASGRTVAELDELTKTEENKKKQKDSRRK